MRSPPTRPSTCSSPGRTQLPGLINGAAGWTVGALVLLVLCKGAAYCFALSGFRGGPVFPGMFIGAARGSRSPTCRACR